MGQKNSVENSESGPYYVWTSSHLSCHRWELSTGVLSLVVKSKGCHYFQGSSFQIMYCETKEVSVLYLRGKRNPQQQLLFWMEHGGSKARSPASFALTNINGQTDSKSPCLSTIFQALCLEAQSKFQEVPLQILPHKGLPSVPWGMLERSKEGCQ